MIKERVLPEWINGVVVKNEQLKQQMIQAFREKQMIKLNELNEETILGIKIDQFIHVGDQIKKEQFSRI
jgi:hypothetical protein